MKKITLGIMLLGLVACTDNRDAENAPTDPNITQQELVEVPLIDKTVYGVGLELTTTEGYDLRGIVVTLKVDEKVWYDTTRIELTKGDTLYSEAVFTDAEVNEGSLVTFEAKTFRFE